MYLFTLLLTLFVGIKFFPSEGIASDTETLLLPPQPTLVAGDIENLIPLAETSYLDGKPVLLFSGANTARNPASLLNFSNSVVFHQEGFMELMLELFPETGTVTTSIGIQGKARKNSSYRFAMGKDPLILEITEDGYYLVFARLRKEMQKGSAIVVVDTESLILTQDIHSVQQGIARWQGSARTYLTKGKHTFAANSAVEQLIIVPQGVFQDYLRHARNILQKKQVSYLFSNDKGGETISAFPGTTSARINTFVPANPGEYQLWAYVSPINEEIHFRNIGLRLSGADLMSDAEIIKDPTGNETAILPFSRYNLDIEEYPHLKVSYDLADPDRNKLGFILELDTDEDDAVDTLCYAGDIRYEEKPFLTINMTNINLKEKDFWYKVNRELGRTKAADLHQWYYDAQGSGFSRNVEGNALAVNSDFSRSNHFVITKNFQPINLKDNQMINLEYKMDNPQVQKLRINFRIDTDGNGRPDRTIETDYGGNVTVAEDGYMRQSINALTHSGVNPEDEKSVCNLVEVIILCSGSGRFYLRDFSIGSRQMVVPEEIGQYLNERTRILNVKKGEEEGSWAKRWRRETFIPLNTVLLNGEEKRERGETVLTIDNILQQVQNMLKNTYYGKLKGFLPLLYHERKAENVSLWKDTLKDALKEIEFFNYDTIEVPQFIAETKAKKEWEQKFEEETLRYGIEKTVYKRDWGNERYDVGEYAVDEWFGVEDIKEAMVAHSEINHWKIDGVNSSFNFSRFLDGVETSFYLDGGSEEDEKVIFIPKMADYQGLDLKQGVSFDVSYELSDPDATELALYLGVDFDGDKKEDATLRLVPSSIEASDIAGRKINIGHFDTSNILKLYPEKEVLCLSSFLLSVEKKQALGFLGANSAVKKVFLHEARIKKKGRDDEDGVRLVMHADKEGRPLLRSLPETETLYKLNFSAPAPLESNVFLRKGWELSSKNTSYQVSYNKEGLAVRGLFYRSGQERYLTLKKYLNGIDLQKYPYMGFRFQVMELGSSDFNKEKLWVELRGKCSPDRNFILRLGGSRFKAGQRYSINLIKELKKIYPDCGDFVLDDIAISIDPTLGRFNENLLAYSSDRWTSDKDVQVNIKNLQVFGVKEKGIEDMLKKTLVREAGGLPGILNKELSWTSEAIANTEFQYRVFGDEQYIRAHFKRDGLKEEGVVLKASIKQPFGLNYIQTVDFDYALDNPEIQGIVVVPEFDGTYRSSSISFLNLIKKGGHISFNIAEKIKDIFRENEAAPAKLTALLFYLIKRAGISCEENDLTDAYTFSIKNIVFTTTTTTTTTTTYDKLLSEPLVEFNGRKYTFGDAFELRKTTGKLAMASSEIHAGGDNNTIAQFVSAGRMPFHLCNVEINDESCKMDINLPSRYLKVDMVEILKPVPVGFKREPGDLSNQNQNIQEPEITFKKINPTRYVVDVRAGRPFWLVFSESFHAGWKAYVRPVTGNREPLTGKTEHWSALISAWRDKGKRIELAEHQMVNGYANGWYVPVGQKSEEREDKIYGDFQIVLEYKPQRLFEIGVLISGMTFISCIGYLCWDGVLRIVYKGRKR